MIPSFQNYGLDTPYFSFKGFKFWARVVDVLDGDTLVVVVNLFDQFFKLKVRLANIDTCEIKSQNPTIHHKAVLARSRLFCLVSNSSNIDICTRDHIQSFLDNHVCLVWLECKNYDKYGRVISDIKKHPDDTFTFSHILLKEHLAYSYLGKTKLDDKSILEKLEPQDTSP